MLPPQFERYGYGVLGIVVGLVIVWLFCKQTREKPAAVGLQWGSRTIKNFFTGFLFGLVLSAAALWIVIQVNGLSIVTITGGNAGEFLMWGMALLLLSLMEEIGFRSFAFVHLKNNWGIWPAQVVIAILFALYHVAGGQSVLTSFLGPGTWAFVFGWAVLYSGGIAMATGIHFAANLLQAAIGQKSGYAALWRIELPGTMDASLQQQIDTTGLLVQLGILLVGITLTMIVSRKKSDGYRKQS